MYPNSYVKSGFPLLSTTRTSDSQRESGSTSSGTSWISNNRSSDPFIRTCSLTRSTAKEDLFSKIVLHCQLSGLSDSTAFMYANPRQNASNSLNDSVDSVASEVYVARATPALIGLIPSTEIVPDKASICFSPAARWPMSHVRLPSSITEPPVATISIDEGMSRVTMTSFRVTPDTFSTSSSISSGPPSPPREIDSERSWSRSGLVSKRSLSTSIRLFFTLYLVLNSLRLSSSSTWMWSPARSVLSVLVIITSIS